jgi:hypothetical protein
MQASYKRDMVEDIRDDTSGYFREILEALILPPRDFDAISLHKAIDGLGTDDSTVIEIMCTRTAAELNQIKLAYQERALFAWFSCVWCISILISLVMA